jgi:chorismate synthase
MSNTLGHNYRVQVFGQSHSPMIGAVIEGIPAGVVPDMDFISAFMARRAPGGALSTARKEADAPQIVSGLNDRGATCGAPLCILIHNTDARSRDYDRLRDIPRPGHADYTAAVKFSGHNDIRGGGQFSGRLTAPLCFAGALALQLLKEKGVAIRARVHSVAGIGDAPVDLAHPPMDGLCPGPLPCVDPDAAARMAEAIEAARADGDSVGGVVECWATGLPAGLGEPWFDSLESQLAHALFSIPAVKGVSFGEGFAISALRGREANDAFRMQGERVVTETNHNGGINGGISNGMPVTFRCAVKPTPSIYIEQPTVDYYNQKEETVVGKGRHDPCIVHRARVVVDSMSAIVVADALLQRYGNDALRAE